MARFAKVVCWILLAAFVLGMTVGFCSLGQCQEPSIEAAKARLQEIERQKQAAKDLADAKAAEELEQQQIIVEQIPLPVPDAISKSEPTITFSRPMSSAPAKPYFERYTASYCQPCRQMEAEGFDEAIRAAGFEMKDPISVDEKPNPDVDRVPQVWLRAADGTPIRRWIGYKRAADVIKPIAVDGLCKLQAKSSTDNAVKGWSGVAIAPGFVLTCAHHEEQNGFYAQFPLSFGAEDYCQIKCALVKADQTADLCLLKFEECQQLQIKHYAVSDLPSDAVVIPGYFQGNKPKRVQVKRQDFRPKVKGLAVDEFLGEGITEAQFGMSGAPLLTPENQVVGIQVLGAKNAISAVSLATIRAFLEDVDLNSESPVVAEVTGAEATPDTLAAVIAAHLVESSGQEPQEPVVYSSLFSFDVDVPDTWKTIGQKILTAQTIDFPAAGLKLDWSGSKRTFSVSATSIEITPSIKATVNKWFIAYSCGLDGFEFEPDLSSVTVRLSGAPDLTVRLK